MTQNKLRWEHSFIYLVPNENHARTPNTATQHCGIVEKRGLITVCPVDLDSLFLNEYSLSVSLFSIAFFFFP